MIFILPILIIPVIFISLLITNKVGDKTKKVCILLQILNLFIILFFRYIFPGPCKYGEIIITIMINIFINILLFTLLINKKIKINNKLVAIVIMFYFLFMIFIPVYKLEDHEHKFNNGEEKILAYEDYYNFYGIKLKRNYK